MIPFSVLDLAPVLQGGDAAQALRHSLELARHAEQLGYERFWLAEHHGIPGVASAATAVVIAHVAGGTSTIRVGAGGIMLPNHAPLIYVCGPTSMVELVAYLLVDRGHMPTRVRTERFGPTAAS